MNSQLLREPAGGLSLTGGEGDDSGSDRQMVSTRYVRARELVGWTPRTTYCVRDSVTTLPAVRPMRRGQSQSGSSSIGAGRRAAGSPASAETGGADCMRAAGETDTDTAGRAPAPRHYFRSLAASHRIASLPRGPWSLSSTYAACPRAGGKAKPAPPAPATGAVQRPALLRAPQRSSFGW